MSLRLLWLLLVLAASFGSMIYYAFGRRLLSAARTKQLRVLIGRARLIDGAKAAELPESTVVRIAGKVRKLDKELSSPLDGKPCVHWRVTVFVLRYSERTGRYGQRYSYWQETIEHAEGAPFVLADDTGECVVDATLGTVGVGRTRRETFPRGRPLPSGLAVLLAGQGVSIEEMRTESWRFEETVLVAGTQAVVVGAGRRVARSAVQGEASYRAAQATWVQLDGQELELLVSDDKRLLQHGPQGDPTDLDPRERWQGRSAVAPDASLVPVDDYEAMLRRRRRVMGFGAIGVLAAGAFAVFVLPGLLRTKSSAPDLLTDEQVTTLRGMTQQQRVAAYRADDTWRAAFAQRGDIVTGDASCAQTASLAGPVAITVASPELPAASPHTAALVAQLDALDAAFPGQPASAYPHQADLAAHVTAPDFDLVAVPAGDAWTLYLYDHATNHVVCRGSAPGAVVADHPNATDPVLATLRAVKAR